MEAQYVGVAFPDHFPLILKVRLPSNMQKAASPKFKPLFKSKPEVIEDRIFQKNLAEQFQRWCNIRFIIKLNVLERWKIIVKPCVKMLMIERDVKLVKI